MPLFGVSLAAISLYMVLSATIKTFDIYVERFRRSRPVCLLSTPPFMLQVVSGLCFPSNPHFAGSSALNYTWLVEVLPLLPAVPHTARRASMLRGAAAISSKIHYLYH